MALPIPTHLSEVAVPLDLPAAADALWVMIRCPCGERRFELRHPGQSVEFDGRDVICAASIQGRDFFLVEAHCAGCGRDHLLLDKDFHGWDGLFCRDAEQAAVPRPPLVPWPCRDCGGLHHLLAVAISGESEEAFLNEAGGHADPAQWRDAFGYFSLDAACAQCGRSERGLVEYETM